MKISDPTVPSAAVPVLGESEYRFACIVWQNEPLPSGRLVQLCAQQLGWKKSTTYTVLKNLIHKGLLQNEGGTVTALIKQDAVRRQQSAAVVERAFEGSLPRFVAAFLDSKPLSRQDADAIREMLARYEEGETP